MLRLYLTKEIRLHIWDSRFRVANVSTIHDHPWDFESFIVYGRLTNYRYKKVEGDGYLFSTIQCGENACTKTKPVPCGLELVSQEVMNGGVTYTQASSEIHQSMPHDGTVTLVERRFKADTEHATVFWPNGSDWVDAAPRPATEAEIEDITSMSLGKTSHNG
jgi:hypothetical protein